MNNADLRLIVCARARRPGRMDRQPHTPPPDPPLASVLAAWRGREGGCQSLTLSGGEPTLRPDLPALIAALADAPRLGLHTDGQALTNPRVLSALSGAGLKRLRLEIHAGRRDAHDWLTDTPGGLKRVSRAAQVALAAGLEVEAEVALTRPGTPLLAETVRVIAGLGVRSVRIRRLVLRGPAAASFAAVSPRFGLAEPYLEAAAEVAREERVALSFHGFPACALGRARDALASPEPVLAPESLAGLFDDPAWGGACPDCPGAPSCAGAPSDYVVQFGDSELRSEGRWETAPVAAPPADPIAPPPPRAGRDAATRLRIMRRQSARKHLAGDPMAGVRPLAIPAALTLPFRAPAPVDCPACASGASQLSTGRTLRLALVRAAQEGAPLLLATGAGSLSHPELIELARDTRRLRMRIQLAGEGAGLAELTEAQRRHLRKAAERIDVALYGPDAARHDGHTGRPGSFERTLAGVAGLEAARAPVGVYAVLHHHEDVADYAAAWASGALPGAPRFRLSHEGGDLRALAAAARDLQGPTRDALAAVLPACLLPREASAVPAAAAAKDWSDPTGGASRGSDPLGEYTPCATCEAAHCPGAAMGWAFTPDSA